MGCHCPRRSRVVALIRARWLDRDVAQQAHAFVQGVHDVLPPLSRALVGFSAAELQAMFCGTHSLDPLADGRWSTRALRAQAIAAATSGNNDNGLPSASVLKAGSGMEVGSQSLRLLYETLALGSRAFRKRFLLFVTGCHHHRLLQLRLCLSMARMCPE